MRNSQKIKKIPIGDGKSFKEAADASGLAKAVIMANMIKPGSERPISKGTYGGLYYKQKWTDDEKSAGAQALGKTIEQIFGPNEKHDQNQTIDSSRSMGNNVHYEPEKNDGDSNDMLFSLIKANQDLAIAFREQAAASKDTAKANLILTELLQKRLGDDEVKKAMAS